MQLKKLCKPSGDEEGAGPVQVNIVRIKNLFYTSSPLGVLPSSPLPTGYRHVLINIQLEGKLHGKMIAEIQCHLAPLYHVSEEAGCALHRDIHELESLLEKHRRDADTSRANVANHPFDIRDLISSVCADSSDIKIDDDRPGQGIPSLLNNAKTPLRSNIADKDKVPKQGESSQLISSPTKSASQDVEPLAPLTPAENDTNATVQKGLETPLAKASMGDVDSRKSSLCDSHGDVSIADLETPKAGPALRQLRDPPVICKDEGDCDMLTALIGCGARKVWKDPRDAGSFNCLFAILSCVLSQDKKDRSLADNSASGTVPSDELVELSRACLRRCLEIGDQGHCTGMTGWVEHQLSGPLRRMCTETPFALLHRLACSHIREGNWVEAEGVFRSLVLRSEQQLPLYHPTVLVSLLDMAAVCAKNSKPRLAEKLVSRAAERLASYLSEMEATHIGHLDQCAVVARSGGYLCQMDQGRDALSMLKAFVEGFQAHLQRELLALMGANHEIVLIHRTFIGDAFAVLANCTTASDASFGRADTESKNSKSFWGLAFVHYRAAFHGFVKHKGLEDPSTACAAYGSARCLRELGETEKALTVLSTVAKVLFERATDGTDHVDGEEGIPTVREATPKERKLTFLPSASLRQSRPSYRTETRRLLSSALCYWLMAVLTAESQQNDEGRVRALKILHKASVSLQRALKVTPADDEFRTTCIDLLRMIEDEAKSILQPIRPMKAGNSSVVGHHHARLGQRPRRVSTHS